MSDLRSPEARARDQFLASAEGRRLCETQILISAGYGKYLQTRIERAFLAGAKWGQENPN